MCREDRKVKTALTKLTKRIRTGLLSVLSVKKRLKIRPEHTELRGLHRGFRQTLGHAQNLCKKTMRRVNIALTKLTKRAGQGLLSVLSVHKLKKGHLDTQEPSGHIKRAPRRIDAQVGPSVRRSRAAAARDASAIDAYRAFPPRAFLERKAQVSHRCWRPWPLLIIWRRCRSIIAAIDQVP